MNPLPTLCTPETEASYKLYKENRSQGFTFTLTGENIIREFDHWVIIHNIFPYDKIAETHDLLISRRVFGSLEEATQEELDEYHRIKKELGTEGEYQFILETMAHTKSIPGHFHLHLLKLKNTI